jgi:hypothetical protein
MSEQPSIAELMARDPLLLSTQDLDTIIADLRMSRSRFVLADDKKIGTPAARKSGAQKNRESIAKSIDVGAINDMLNGL